MAAAGFVDIHIEAKPESAEWVREWAKGAENYVASAVIEARKP